MEGVYGWATWKSAAERFRVNVALVGTLLKQRHVTGSIEPRRGWIGQFGRRWKRNGTELEGRQVKR